VSATEQEREPHTQSAPDRPAEGSRRRGGRFLRHARAVPPGAGHRRETIPFLQCGPEVVLALSTGDTAFQDIALAFFFGREPRRDTDASHAIRPEDREQLREHFDVLIENFKAEHGSIVRSYFASHCLAAAALTSKDEIEVVLVGDLPPSELIQIIRRAQGLGYSAWHRLEEFDRRLCQRMVFSVILEVLRRLDHAVASQPTGGESNGPAFKQMSAADLAFLRANLDEAEDFMLRCATRRAQTQYMHGMLRHGSLLVLPMLVIAVVAALVNDSFNNTLGQAVLVSIAGAGGAMVSVMWRMTSGTFSINLPTLGGRAGDSQLHLMGAVRPAIGAVFALAVFVIVKSPLIPLEAGSKSDTYLLAALGFLAGFSERFAQDMFVRSGEGLAGPGGDSPSTGLSAGLAPPPGAGSRTRG
jgi:hypothetical protein